MQLGDVHLTGRWLNDRGEVEREPYLFIYSISLRHADKFARRYAQDSYVYCGPETGRWVHHVDLRNHRTIELGRFHARTINKSWSEVRGRPHHAFVFESWGVVDRIDLNYRLAKAKKALGV